MTSEPLKEKTDWAFRDLVTLYESDLLLGEKATEAMQMQVVCVAARARQHPASAE